MAIQKLSESSIRMSRSNKMVYVKPLVNARNTSFQQDDSSTAASQPAALLAARFFRVHLSIGLERNRLPEATQIQLWLLDETT